MQVNKDHDNKARANGFEPVDMGVLNHALSIAQLEDDGLLTAEKIYEYKQEYLKGYGMTYRQVIKEYS